MADSVGSRHATSRYQQVNEGLIDELQRAYRRGDDLHRIAAWVAMNDKRVIIAETLDADRIVDMPIKTLLAGGETLGPMTDFKWAAAAERLMTGSHGDQAARSARASALLEEAGRSPTASPTLAYEPLYRDRAEAALLDKRGEALDWLRRVLAHNLHFNDGDDVLFALIDLVSAHLQLDRLDEGLTMLAALIRDAPGNQWIYRFMATGFGVLGLADLGLRGARKGLVILDEVDDPDDLHDELLMAEFDLLATKNRGREGEVSPEVLAELDAALGLPIDGGDHLAPAALCQRLVTDLDDVPVKRPLRFADLPPAVRAPLT